MKYKKAIYLLTNAIYRKGLFNGVAAAIEHEKIMKFLSGDGIRSVIDIGANCGQFALLAKYIFKNAHIISFEPLETAAGTFKELFSTDSDVVLHEKAIGPTITEAEIHVSQREDSSSLLPITDLQNDIYPGTAEQSLAKIQVVPLKEIIQENDIKRPALLKIDVQGFEMEVLKGCFPLIHCFKYIYVECSFLELYEQQAMAHEIIERLNDWGYEMRGVYNMFYDKKGVAVQGDFLFQMSEDSIG